MEYLSGVYIWFNYNIRVKDVVVKSIDLVVECEYFIVKELNIDYVR